MDRNMLSHYRIWSVPVRTFLSIFISLASGIPDELIHSSGDVTGTIAFHQTDGNSTYLRDSGDLASYVPTLVTFELSDPRHDLNSASVIYTWELGNGEVFEGPEPFVQCSYTTPGNYTFKLYIGANTTKQSRITGLYSIDLTVLDAIRSVEFKGPLNYIVDQSSTLSFHVGGSPPAWLCWRVLFDCVSPGRTSCNLIRLYKNVFGLNYTFTSIGTYCLELSVRNDISDLQTSYNVYVQNSPVNHLIFILPCAAVIFATLIFISISVCCPLQDSCLVSQTPVADMNGLSPTDIPMYAKDETTLLRDTCLFPTSEREGDEALPLLHHPGTLYNTQPC